ncbi:MAG: hypothetical protein ACKVVP_05565 [Chloroflexota bacterium]
MPLSIPRFWQHTHLASQGTSLMTHAFQVKDHAVMANTHPAHIRHVHR